MTSLALATESHHDALAALQQATDRFLAPLAPMFVAIKTTWTAPIRPESVARSMILMTFFDFDGADLLCREVRARAALFQFLQMEQDEAAGLTAAGLERGLDRLTKNQNIRDGLRDVLTSARDSGLLDHHAFHPSQTLIRQWTSIRPVS